MRAVLARGPGDFALVDQPEPAAGDGALLRVEAAGVCAADRMLWRGDGPWQLTWPFVPGHEVLARVAEVAPAAAQAWGVGPGDRVTVEVKVPCGSCRWCREGRENLCPHGAHIGSALPGAFAEALAVPPAARLHRVPAELPLAAAVLVEPAACAVHAVRRAALLPGETLTVVGLGSIGSLAVGVARAAGHEVEVVLRDLRRAERAYALGASRVLTTGSWPAESAEVVLDCSGSAAAVSAALQALRPGGRLVLYGVYRRPAELDLNTLAEHKELTVSGGHLAPGAFPEAVRLLASGALGPEGVVDEVLPLTEVRRALEPAPTPRAKVVLLP